LVSEKLRRLHEVVSRSRELPPISSDVSHQIGRIIKSAPTDTLIRNRCLSNDQYH
jgi:hypothetical protein